MTENETDLNSLTAISPLDGRYRNRLEDLAPFTSEMALIKTRFEVESKYLVALSDVGLVRDLNPQERNMLLRLGPDMTLERAVRVKQIEDTTSHDVKAIERAFREFVGGTSLKDVTEMIHFGLTSEDINNVSYRLLLERARKQICIPALDEVVDDFAARAAQFKGLPMLARTHGQGAVPTTLGKEMANIAVRLNRQTRKLEKVTLTGKLNGAVGNYNAHSLAAPEVNWISFSIRFIESLGLEPNLFTTQINPYDDMIEMFQAFQRVNGVFLDIDQDMWRYISDNWFIQEVAKDHVGSSTMPQKVNPIDFENSEGNIQLANSLWEGMDRKLAVSRLQRDLSDSTTVRNVGAGVGYGLLSYRNTLAGLQKVHPNVEGIDGALHENWAILSEGVQTVLRRAGIEDPYSMVAALTRGQRIEKSEWQDWIGGLPIEDNEKTKLRNLTPGTYIGYAEELTEMALSEIEASRKSK